MLTHLRDGHTARGDKKTAMLLVLMLGLAMLSACATTPPTEVASAPDVTTEAVEAETPSPEATQDEMPACALTVPGTTATLVDTPEGINVEFVSTEAAEALRKRVVDRQAFKKAHPKPMPVKMSAETENMPDGIRLIIRAADTADVEKVQAMVRKMITKAQAEHSAP